MHFPVAVHAALTDGLVAHYRAPLFPIPADSPEYYGTVVAEPSVTSQLPVIYRFVETPVGIDNDPGTRCSVFFSGEFYDNLEIRIRRQTPAAHARCSEDAANRDQLTIHLK